MHSLNQIYSEGKDEMWTVAVTQSTLYVSEDLNKLDIQGLPSKYVWPGEGRQNISDLTFMQCTFKDHSKKNNRENPWERVLKIRE